MNSVLERTSNIDKFLTELEQDNTAKNEIENKIVSIGTDAIPELVNKLQIVRGITRGVVAMSLIRIGDDSIEHLRRAADANKDFAWIAQYLISEISNTIAA